MNKNINTILIANRGEIATRIIRTCKKMGIQSIAIFSDADRDSLYVKDADFAIYAGASNPSESYLDQAKVIEIAQAQGADAIHPGYGFLSENAEFAKRCADAGIIFIGPNPKSIEAMGSKSQAKSIMKTHNVPVIPGYQGEDQTQGRIIEEAKKIGFPLLLKATAGGGGKGMRIVHQDSELVSHIESAKREAMSSFGDDELIIEKYISKGRHIEFQIFGDQQGQVIHLLERECTIQRRYQKVIEESPSPALTEDLRLRMGAAAVHAAQAINYYNAGTVEFIYDDHSQEFFFLEVNTRLQVEHPVTEEITGLDLVEMQIEIAEGKPLTISQEEVIANGYAVEARLYAEDPTNNFYPATGQIHHWDVPQVEGLRIESAVSSGSKISIHYDPMIAKIIIWDKNRQSAHRKMAYVLNNLKCQGLATNQDFLMHLFRQDEINTGDYDTHYIQNHFDPEAFKAKDPHHIHAAAIATTLYKWNHRNQQRSILRSMPSGWRSSYYQPQESAYIYDDKDLIVKYRANTQTQFEFYIDDKTYAVEFYSCHETDLSFRLDNIQHRISIATTDNKVYIHGQNIGNIQLTKKDRFPRIENDKVEGGYKSSMPSQIIKLLVEINQSVNEGDPLLITSSMKMENTILAEKDGIVKVIHVNEGQNIEAGVLLLEIE